MSRELEKVKREPTSLANAGPPTQAPRFRRARYGKNGLLVGWRGSEKIYWHLQVCPDVKDAAEFDIEFPKMSVGQVLPF